MKKPLVALSFLIIFSLVLSLTAWTASLQIFVRNQPVKSHFVKGGQVFVQVEEFLKAGRFSWTQQGDTVTVSDKKGDTPRIAGTPSKYIFNGNQFTVPSEVKNEYLYGNIIFLAGGLGMTYKYNAQTGQYDVFYKVKQAPPSRMTDTPTTAVTKTGSENKSSGDTPTATSTGGGSSSSSSSEEDDKAGKPVTFKGDKLKDSLIKPSNDFFSDWQSGEVRGNVSFKNSYKESIENISVVFMIVDGTGKVLTKESYNIGTLEAGASSKKYEYFYINPSQFTINDSNFTYEITYKQPAKSEDK